MADGSSSPQKVRQFSPKSTVDSFAATKNEWLACLELRHEEPDYSSRTYNSGVPNQLPSMTHHDK
ncbi:hypothetical protein [Tateyamaria sp. SN3-11]|uniref:hypothetical protein n=1 Tax=Tateyamaria sp. SN3-11 TaxID=3092147 RepID=UPI0039ED1F28